MVGWPAGTCLHEFPITDHEPEYLKQIRISVLVSFLKLSVSLARPGTVHCCATWRTLACTAGSPSRKDTVMMFPGLHLLALTRAARSWPSAVSPPAIQAKQLSSTLEVG